MFFFEMRQHKNAKTQFSFEQDPYHPLSLNFQDTLPLSFIKGGDNKISYGELQLKVTYMSWTMER